jgi:hypothetical protein
VGQGGKGSMAVTGVADSVWGGIPGQVEEEVRLGPDLGLRGSGCAMRRECRNSRGEERSGRVYFRGRAEDSEGGLTAT